MRAMDRLGGVWWGLLVSIAWLALASSVAPPARAAEAAETATAAGAVQVIDAVLSDGARWTARVPAHWNGTLLLYSHGYDFALRPPQAAPPGVETWLLAHGFALTASAYAEPGWALAQAVPDQLATLDAFARRFGQPARTIAWGDSMGGLVTVALIERHPERFAGALSECGSLAGSLGMMNEALDGAFAFRTLLAPDSGIRLVATGDDRANGARVERMLEQARRTPAGQARIALASALAQLPTWTVRGSSEPAAEDWQGQFSQVAAAFVMGVFLPRADQERRAGGVFSWNTHVDYRAQLRRSGRRAWVEGFYRRAGLSLDTDLARLAAAPRVQAQAPAVAYLRANYVPSGQLQRPVLTMHTIGDSATVPTQEAAYRQTVGQAASTALLAQSWVARAGHCQFTPAEQIAALQTLLARVDRGHWEAAPAALTARAAALSLGSSAFISYRPAPFLRPCTRAQCPGRPEEGP